MFGSFGHGARRPSIIDRSAVVSRLLSRRVLAIATLAICALVVLAVWSSRDSAVPAELIDTSAPPQLPTSPVAAPETSAEASPFAALVAPVPTPAIDIRQRRVYEVKAGDTLVDIANAYGLRPETLVWANRVSNADLILIGQQFRIPPVDGLFYQVKPGERLVDIVDRHGVDISQVIAANEIDDPDLIVAGLELFMPGARPIAPTSGTGASSAAQPAEMPLEQIEITEQIAAAANAAWVAVAGEVPLFAAPGLGARVITNLPAGVRLERTGPLEGSRLPVFAPGDGQTRLAFAGWIDVRSVEPARALTARQLPKSYPDNTRMDVVQVLAPFRTQLDGSPYAGANCGPASLSMALGALGTVGSPGELRRNVLNAQRMWGNDTGTLITALAQVAEDYGATAVGLYEGGAIRRWSLDDLREQLNLRRPVIVQTRYRALPGRERVAFAGDHYIVLTAAIDDAFLYNDPVDSDGVGWDRIISAQRLYQAMDASDRRYVYAGFALTR